MHKHDSSSFWALVQRGEPDECWLWTRATLYGYGTVRFQGQTKRAHRVAWELTHGPIPPGLCACHTCDNPPCCNPAHMFLGTRADNNADKMRKGRHGHSGGGIGERNGSAKLTAAQVREIRATKGVSQCEMGRRYGVSQSTIRMILIREHWKHVV